MLHKIIFYVYKHENITPRKA